MCTITLELPDELVDKDRQKGLLSSTAIESCTLLDEAHSDAEYPPDIAPRLIGLVSPKLYGKGRITGDIIGPFHDEWENGY
ncbi:hypothetical protein FACS1894200_12050 [Spirochaetia bacterium]|nr:hypothetical protein FACS1894200_12050 [Spirochaetia bacterium]